MKKFYVFILSGLVFFGFSNGYNCSTINSRMDNFLDRYEDFTNRYDTHARVWQRVSNEYEASLRFEDYYKLEAEKDRIDAEREVLLEEYDRCKEQDEKYKDYLRAWWKALKELQESDTYDSSLIEKGISNYEKALDVAISSKITTADVSGLKEQIANLKSYKEEEDAKLKARQQTKTTTNKEKQETKITTNKEKQETKITTTENNNTNTDIILTPQTVIYDIWDTGKKAMTSTSKSDEFQMAINWMYDNWLTIYNNKSDFMWSSYITREQASKFFVQFASNVFGKDKWLISSYDTFSDIKNANPTLKDYIIYSSNMWLFKWINGKFKPFDNLTKAQAVAVAIRIMKWYQDETQSIPYRRHTAVYWEDITYNGWYSVYFNYADSYLATKRRWDYDFTKLDSEYITREDLALILYNLYVYDSYYNKFDYCLPSWLRQILCHNF